MGKVEYITVEKAAELWKLSQRSVRNYCAEGRVAGSFLDGGVWRIPSTAAKPKRKKRHSKKKSNLLSFLKREKDADAKGGIYHKIQIDLTYNSNHMEGSRLSRDQTRHIYETNTLAFADEALRIDDIVETVNHFRCVDLVIEAASSKLTESFIKQLHYTLKRGTGDERKPWFRVGEYKTLENEVGGSVTVRPEDVPSEMKTLLNDYNSRKEITFDDILEFHVRFEAIHPFQDGNGRVGRLIIFKECLKHNIVPFIITEELKLFYYRGIKEWKNEHGYLRDTCLTAQDFMKEILVKFGVGF